MAVLMHRTECTAGVSVKESRRKGWSVCVCGGGASITIINFTSLEKGGCRERKTTGKKRER